MHHFATNNDSIRLQFSVIYWTGEDMYHPATEINDCSAESAGWLSPKNCYYPQELGFKFATLSHITQIEFYSCHFMPVTKVELFVGKGKTYNRAKFQRVGFICMKRANHPKHQDQELRSAQLAVKGNFVKFRIHGYFVNRDNVFNQVGIRALTFWGKYLSSPEIEDHLFLCSDNMMQHSTNCTVSSEVLAKRNRLCLLKEEAEIGEDYTAALQYKHLEMYLEDLEEQFEQLQIEKQKAVKIEDYDAASTLKIQIESILDQISHILDFAPLTLTNNESQKMVCNTKLVLSKGIPESSRFLGGDNNLSLWQSDDSFRHLDGIPELHGGENDIINKLLDPAVSSVASKLPPTPLSYPPVAALKNRYNFGQKRRISPTFDQQSFSTDDAESSNQPSSSLNNTDSTVGLQNNFESSNGQVSPTKIFRILEHNMTLIFSVAIGIVDFFTDIMVINTYYEKNHRYWACLSLSLVLLTSFMDAYTGYHEMKCIGGHRVTGAICGFFHFLPAYAAFLCLKNYYNHHEILAEWAKADAANARFKIALWESMPQVVLQFHIIMIYLSAGEELERTILLSCVASLVSLSYTFADFWNKKFSKFSFFPNPSKVMEWLWAMSFLLLSSSTVVLKTTSLVVLSSSIREFIFLVFGIMLGTRMALNAHFHGQEYFDKRKNKSMQFFFELFKLARKSVPNVLHDFLFVKQIKHAGIVMIIHTAEVLGCLILPAKGVGRGIPGGTQNIIYFEILFAGCFSLEVFLVFFIFRKFYKVGLYIPLRVLESSISMENVKTDNNDAGDDDDERVLDYFGIEAMWTEKLTEKQKESGINLIKAAKLGQSDALSQILVSNCSALITSVFGQLALEEGIRNRQKKSVELLLERNNDLVDKMGSIFYDSCLYGRLKSVDWCIEFLKSKTHQDNGNEGEKSIKTNKVTSVWNCMDVLRNPELLWLKVVLEYKDTDGPFGWTPLQAAARMGHEKVVQSLIEAGVDVNATTTHGSTALLLAAYYGKLSCVELLIEAKTDEGQGMKGYRQKDALYWATKKNHQKIKEKLRRFKEESQPRSPRLIHSQTHRKQSKLDVSPQDFFNKCLQCKDDATALQNLTSILDHALAQSKLTTLLEYKDTDGPLEWTPICAATRHGYPGLLQLLLDYGADITAESKNGGSVLNLAIQHNEVSCAQIIIEAVVQTDKKIILTKKFESKTPLQHAKTLGHKDIVTLLYTADVGWNRAFDFYEICTAGNHEEVRKALQRLKNYHENDTMTALLEFRDMDGPVRWTPLHSATRYGRVEVVKVLLEFGADVEGKTKLGSNALFLAAYYGQSSCAEQLLKYGSNVATEYKGKNALDWARQRGFYDVVKVLENAGLKKPEDVKGISPEEFYNACNAGHYKEVKKILKTLNGNETAKKKLFEHKAEPPLEWVPLHVAARMGHKKIVKLLLDSGAELEAQTCLKSNALLLAAYYGQPECVKILLNRGSNHSVRFKGKTPLEWAETKGHIEVVKLLQGKSTSPENVLQNTTNKVIAAGRFHPSDG